MQSRNVWNDSRLCEINSSLDVAISPAAHPRVSADIVTLYTDAVIIRNYELDQEVSGAVAGKASKSVRSNAHLNAAYDDDIEHHSLVIAAFRYRIDGV